MSPSDFTTTMLVDQTPKKAFNAINNVRGWWTENSEGITQKLNDEFTVRFGETFITMRIAEMIPDRKVVWLVIDCYKHWLKNNKTEWTGTKISFDISEKDDKTQILFTHFGLIPTLECFDGCANAWSEYLYQSLLGLITKNKGKPTPKEPGKMATK